MNANKIKLNKKLLKKNKVGLVFLFGSQITGARHPQSDIDLGVVFEDETIRKKKPLEVYSDLYEAFSNSFKSLNIDIVYLREAPLALQFKAIDEGKVVYKISGKFFADYREEVMIRYFDFRFTEDYFNQVFLGKSL